MIHVIRFPSNDTDVSSSCYLSECSPPGRDPHPHGLHPKEVRPPWSPSLNALVLGHRKQVVKKPVVPIGGVAL